MLERLFCMRLRTAGIVIGWIGVVLSSLMIFELSYTLLMIMYSVAAAITWIWLLVFLFWTLAVLSLISSVLLIWGAKKERHSLVLLWLINSAIRIIITNLYSVTWYILTVTSDKPVKVNTPVWLFVLIAGLALEIYVFCGIFSLYKQLKHPSSQENPTTKPPADASVEYKTNTSYAQV